jgi:enoyl-CoA hydratase
MSPVHIEARGDVGVLRMEHGKVQALDTELCRALAAAVRQLMVSGARAAVLTGTGGSFSAGVDLLRITSGGPTYVEEFLPALDQAFAALLELELPLIAAINGHAIAGGCVLACACDWRVMGDERGRIGVPELHVGVPFPSLALEILRNALPASLTRELVYFGITLEAVDAHARGLVDEVVPADRVLPRVLELAQRLTALPREATAQAKQRLRSGVIERWKAAREHDARVLELWKSPATAEAIHSYMERLAKRAR